MSGMQPQFTVKTLKVTKILSSILHLHSTKLLYDLSPINCLANLKDWYCKLQSYKWMNAFRDPEGLRRYKSLTVQSGRRCKS